MEPAKKLEQPRTWESPRAVAPKPREPVGQSRQESEELMIKVGKIIFYLTVATSIWFFYWLNGVQCPC